MTNGRGTDQAGSSDAHHGGLRVFISYAHDDAAHENRVRAFWWFLRENGVDARADLPAAERRQDWAEWMTREVRDADWVLVVASREYRQRAEGDAGPSEGRGVQWEARLIRDRFYADQKAGLQSIIPVILPGCSADDIPLWMGRTATTYYSVREYTVDGAEELLRLLTGQPWETQPPLGIVPNLPPRTFSKIDQQLNPQISTQESLLDIIADVYRSILRRRSEHYNHRVAATHLAELGPGYVDEALGILREIWQDEADSGEDADVYLFFSTQFLLQFSEHKSEAIRRLRQVLQSAPAETNSRFFAARTLAAIGGDQLQEALTELYALIAEHFSPAVARHILLLDYHSAFEVLGPKLLQNIKDDDASMWDRLSSAAILLACHENHSSIVMPILRAVLENLDIEASHRIRAAAIISWADERLNRVVIEGMLSIITNPVSESYDVGQAIDCLNNLRSICETDADLITATLRRELDAHYFSVHELEIAKLLYRLNAGFNGDEYVGTLRKVLNSHSIWAKRMAAVELMSYDARYIPEAVGILHGIVASPPQDRSDHYNIQVLAAEDLLALGKRYARPVCHFLKKPLVAPVMGFLDERERMAKILIECAGPESTISLLRQGLASAESKVPRNAYVLIELASTLAYCAKYMQSRTENNLVP